MKQPNSAASNSTFEFDALDGAKNYRHAIQSALAPFLKGKVLEIGAGAGQITREISQIRGVTQVTALEPELQFHQELARRNPGVSIIRGCIRDVQETGWDAMISVNVLEHIQDDIGELQEYQARLKAGGALCLFVPARPELYSPIDSDFGHFRRYTKPGLRCVLEKAGFELQQLRYFNFIGYFTWLMACRILQQRVFSPGSISVFDRWIFPVTNRLESLCPPPVGQSLIAIGKA